MILNHLIISNDLQKISILVVYQEIPITYKKNKKTFINDQILADEVIFIGSDGKNHGLVKIDEAKNFANKESLDLVQVSPSEANPVICKALDYGKHIFEKKKNTSSAKSKVKRNTVKEIKFRPSTDVGDYNIKLNKIKSFILSGDKTKITVRFRGREILNSALGLDMMNKLSSELSDIAQVDQEPSLEGRQLLMVLSPLKKKN